MILRQRLRWQDAFMGFEDSGMTPTVYDTVVASVEAFLAQIGCTDFVFVEDDGYIGGFTYYGMEYKPEGYLESVMRELPTSLTDELEKFFDENFAIYLDDWAEKQPVITISRAGKVSKEFQVTRERLRPAGTLRS
jgi:hypothetical protein